MRSFALILLSASLLGCAVPLGPGFNQPFRSVDVSATSVEPTHIHVQVTDKLENVGDRSLSYLDVGLPRGPSFGTGGVSITIDGRAVPIERINTASGPVLRIPFDPPWPQRGLREIGFAYDLDPAPQGRGVVAATNDGFYLADPNVFPSWQRPVAPFATGSLRAQTEELEVTVPADFHVLAVGTERQSQRRGEFVLRRFETRGAQFPPYLVAGRYHELRADTQHGTVIFWTRESLDEETARSAAQRLAATVATYQNLFGPVIRNPFPIHIVETSAKLAPIIVVTPNIAATSFPGGVLLDQRAVALGLASDPVLDLTEYELARTWFGWHVHPQPEVDLLLGRGMSIFAGLLAAEARGGMPARQQGVRQLIETYESFGPAAHEKTGFGPVVNYTREQIRAQSYKGALFLIELQDIVGKETFYRALRRLLAAMAGQEIGSDVLRSTLEEAPRRDLAPVFHAWFDRPGLPAEFRERYPAAQ
jgi:hypothetical protein